MDSISNDNLAVFLGFTPESDLNKSQALARVVMRNKEHAVWKTRERVRNSLLRDDFDLSYVTNELKLFSSLILTLSKLYLEDFILFTYTSTRSELIIFLNALVEGDDAFSYVKRIVDNSKLNKGDGSAKLALQFSSGYE